MPIFDFKNEYDEIISFLKNNNYYFKNVTFLKNFSSIPKMLETDLYFEDCSFPTKNFEIGDSEPFNHSNLSSGQSISFRRCQFNNLIFKDISNINDITFEYSKIRKVEVDSSSQLPASLNFIAETEINTILMLSLNITTNIIFRIDRLDYLELSQLHNSGFLSIAPYNGVRIIYIEEFLNFDYFEMDYIGNQSTNAGRLYMGHNRFGKSNFNDSDFSTYNEFIYLNNNISELTCSDCQWKSKDLNMTASERLDYFRDITNLITTGSAEFQKFNRSFLDCLLKYSNLPDKIIIIFSKLISNHCTNWLLPIFWLVIINLVTIHLLNLSLSAKLVPLHDITVLLNPLHLNSHYSVWNAIKDNLTNQFIALDIISRAFNASALYHLVKTFRRFHSKSL